MKTLLQLLSILFITLSFTACGGGSGTALDSNSSMDKVKQIIAGEPVTITAEELNAIEGVSGAVEGRDYTGAIRDGSYADSTNPTPAEIQAIIESVNTAENHSPIIQDFNINTNEDTSKSFTLTGSDADGDTLTYSITTQPSHGSISGNTYTPAPNYHGSDSFKYKANDGTVDSAEATVTITVTSVNDAPVIEASLGTEEDARVYIRDHISDPEGGYFTYQVTSAPSHGYIKSGYYYPNQNYHGEDSYTLRACDRDQACSTQTVTLTVTPVNDAPFAYSSSYNLEVDGGIAIELNATDVDGDALSYEIIQQPTHGSYTNEAYTPESGYEGLDYLTYRATDTEGLSSTGRVYFNVGIPAPYITIWDTTITHYEDPVISSRSYDSNTSSTELKIGTNPDQNYNFTIAWGDGTTDSNVTATITHTYASEGNYTVIISGLYPQPWEGDYLSAENYKHYDAMKLRSIEQWGSMAFAYYKAHNMQMHATDKPDLSNVTDMRHMFSRASAFNQPLEGWDVSGVTNMFFMFSNASAFNQPLEDWDVSKVTDMYAMLYEASAFNQPLEGWDVSNVTSMGFMFCRASAFNQPLEDWDVSGVTNMSYMFSGASAFNQPLEDWDVSGVTDMRYMFYRAVSFDQDCPRSHVARGNAYSNQNYQKRSTSNNPSTPS